MSLQSRIDEELTKDDANLHEELGHKIYVSVKTPYRCVHIRRYYKKWSPATCTSSMFPTRDGITFKRRDWDQVKSVALLLARNHANIFTDEINEALLCVVCLTNQRSVVLKPCRHFGICQNCSKSLERCPICRSAIDEKHEVYFS